MGEPTWLSPRAVLTHIGLCTYNAGIFRVLNEFHFLDAKTPFCVKANIHYTTLVVHIFNLAILIVTQRGLFDLWFPSVARSPSLVHIFDPLLNP